MVVFDVRTHDYPESIMYFGLFSTLRKAKAHARKVVSESRYPDDFKRHPIVIYKTPVDNPELEGELVWEYNDEG